MNDRRQGNNRRDGNFSRYIDENRKDYQRSSQGQKRKQFNKTRKEDFRKNREIRDEVPGFEREENYEEIRLNKYIANAGICSRREADELIRSGQVTVNGEVVTELGHKIKPGEQVVYDGKVLKGELLRYVLLNKPKGFVTTMDDPEGRKTVMDLVKTSCRERIYPVGRLDMYTTGLLLFTNDGEMAKKLTHPKHNIRKIYQVTLNRPLTKADFDGILAGFDLDDGAVKVDDLAYLSREGGDEVGIEIHSGKNRIVRRIFKHFGYEVIKLDRVYFAGLTKKNLPRGKWRHLNASEVKFLKMM